MNYTDKLQYFPPFYSKKGPLEALFMSHLYTWMHFWLRFPVQVFRNRADNRSNPRDLYRGKRLLPSISVRVRLVHKSSSVMNTTVPYRLSYRVKETQKPSKPTKTNETYLPLKQTFIGPFFKSTLAEIYFIIYNEVGSLFRDN